MKIIRGRPDGSRSAPWVDHLTGTAWMDLLLQEADDDRTGGTGSTVTMTSATFTPGSRSHWHRHSATNDSQLTHIALTLGTTHWYDEPVDIAGGNS
jgi:hypothetical protein